MVLIFADSQNGQLRMKTLEMLTKVSHARLIAVIFRQLSAAFASGS